jgi:ribosomal protein S18 acetylase RimI-like enzyme
MSAAEAWPALTTEVVRGWTCRSAGGYSQRANSCLPLTDPQTDLGGRITAVEAWFARQAQPAVFKVPEQKPWEALDAALEQRGYGLATPSKVLSKPAVQQTGSPEVHVSETFTERWWQGYAPAAELAPRNREAALRIAALVARPVVVWANDAGRDVAWAFTSLVGSRAWVFDVVVNPASRRRGWGRALLQTLEAEAARRGAQTLHLQVMADNQGARSLYAGLGFEESYGYHYRRQPQKKDER